METEDEFNGGTTLQIARAVVWLLILGSIVAFWGLVGWSLMQWYR